MSDAARAMWDHDVGMLPVIDPDGRVVGAITDRDIAMAAYTQGKPLSDISVESARSPRAFTARTTTPLEELERKMARNQIRRVPVVDEDGRCIGVVSTNDLAMHTSRSRGALVSDAELASTMRAICHPRAEPELNAE